MHCVIQVLFCALSFIRRGVPDSSTVQLPRSETSKNSELHNHSFLTSESEIEIGAPYKSVLNARGIDAVCDGAALLRKCEHLHRRRGRTAAKRVRARLPVVSRVVAKAGHDYQGLRSSGGLQ
jgi:hypothetical protein